jgi:hypothetical protein
MTAVEWLVNHWKKLQAEREKMSWNQIIDITELAKEMEKEQKEYFFNCGRQYQLTGEGTFTEVYNETYKKD